MTAPTFATRSDNSAPSVRILGTCLYFLPVQTRVPYQFGSETMTEVICARVCLRVRGLDGVEADGWGETPLSVQWVWPGAVPFQERAEALREFCACLAQKWASLSETGHPLEIGHAFLERELGSVLREFNQTRTADAQMPWLAALVCCSPFDLALYDAFGNLTGKPVYETLSRKYLSNDLTAYLTPAEDASVSFAGKYPSDYLVPRSNAVPAWHSVGGSDPVLPGELLGDEPQDGYPLLLRDWIVRDGLFCLKVKLRGLDAVWDYNRLVTVGRIGMETGVHWLCADYNCTAPDVAYVAEMLDRLMRDEPRIYGMLLYVEQPFPYDLEANPLDVHPLSARKPLFMDESAHDWRLVRHGRKLGWSSVALKTCKTQTGALLSLCWARAHGMTLMVQDLTNPMLATIPHALLAAHAGTIMGLECNAPQYYPEASRPEAAVHPGIYTLRHGKIDLTSIRGSGFGYRINEIHRELPAPAVNYLG